MAVKSSMVIKYAAADCNQVLIDMNKRRKNVRPKISKEQLDQIVQNVTRKTNTDTDEFEELDLSELSSIDEQIEFLKSQDRIDTMYVT